METTRLTSNLISNLISNWRKPMLATLESTTYLGPARVLTAAGNRAKLELPDEYVWAVVALGMPYEPAVDDVVLAIGQKGSWYVIGLIQARGKTTLTVPGDLEIRAPRGGIQLSAATNVTVKGPEVTIAANKLELFAKSVFERFTAATRWVKEAFQLHAGRCRTRVDGCYELSAERIRERAEREVKIDGSKIHLG
jgi:hypothetical protein